MVETFKEIRSEDGFVEIGKLVDYLLETYSYERIIVSILLTLLIVYFSFKFIELIGVFYIVIFGSINVIYCKITNTLYIPNQLEPISDWFTYQINMRKYIQSSEHIGKKMPRKYRKKFPLMELDEDKRITGFSFMKER